jgi:hypothetical protein
LRDQIKEESNTSCSHSYHMKKACHSRPWHCNWYRHLSILWAAILRLTLQLFYKFDVCEQQQTLSMPISPLVHCNPLHPQYPTKMT